jgi:MFS family permease
MAGNSRQIERADNDLLNVNGNIKSPESFLDILFAMLGSSAIGALLASALAFIVVGGIWLFAAAPVVLALTPFIPIIFAAAAWGGAGIGGGITGFCIAISNLIKDPNNVPGWLALGLGLMGTFATAGAVIGTFIPVPILGSLVGAASGAVMGVIIGAAAWVLSGIIGAIVIAATPPIKESTLVHSSDVEDKKQNTHDSQLSNEDVPSHSVGNSFFAEDNSEDNNRTNACHSVENMNSDDGYNII